MKKKIQTTENTIKKDHSHFIPKDIFGLCCPDSIFSDAFLFSVPDLLFCTASEYPFDGRYVYPLSFNDRSAFFSRLFFYDHP